MLQSVPHLVVLSKEFYKSAMLPHLADWTAIFLEKHVNGQVGSAELRRLLRSPYKLEDGIKEKLRVADDGVLKPLNLAVHWLHELLPHVLSKVHRVSYGLLCGEDLESSCLGLLRVTIFRNLGGRDSGVCVDVGWLCLSWEKIAQASSVGLDLADNRSEFSHPDVTIGFTILAYRFTGLRGPPEAAGDLRELLKALLDEMKIESTARGQAVEVSMCFMKSTVQNVSRPRVVELDGSYAALGRPELTFPLAGWNRDGGKTGGLFLWGLGEMSWWTSSIDLEGTRRYNLAARFLMSQSGIVRQRGEEFAPEELEYQKEEKARDPETGEEVVITPEDLLAGLNKLLAALETLNGQSVLDRRGELRTQFYLHLARKPAERVADFASRFRTAVSDLKSEGVRLPDAEVGWFFKEKLGLAALRRQLLETTLQGAEGYSTIESECLRLFRDLHLQDPLYRKLDPGPPGRLTVRQMFGVPAGTPSSSTSTAASSMAPSRRSSLLSSAPSSSYNASRRPPLRQAQVTEQMDIEGETEAEHVEPEAVDNPEGDEPASLEEVLQTQVQNLAEEIAEAEEEGIDPLHLESLEQGIEASAEALVSMREARVKLAEMRKDRGFRGPPSSGGGAPKGRGKGSAAIAAKKASGKHVCCDCGLPGHWAGDEACTKPGQGGGTVPEHEVTQAEATEAQELLMISAECSSPAVKHALDLSAARATEVHATSAGEPWIKNYVELLRAAPAEVQALVTTEPETEQFKFGNGGGILPSTLRWRLPIMMAGELVLLWISAVPVATLGLLIGRDVLDAVGGILDFSERTLSCRAFGAKTARLLQLSAGHLALPLIPESWPHVPKTRWRKLGPDGVLETVMSCKQWAQQLLRGVSRAAPDSEEHSHNMTEASLTLGQIAFEYNSTLLTTAQRMCTEAVPALAPVASSSVAVRPKDGGGIGLRRPTFKSSWLRWAWLPRRRRRRKLRSASCGPMAEDDHESSGALGLGKARAALGFGKAARLALLAVSLAIGLFGGYVEKPGRDNVPAWCLSSSLAGPWHLDGGHLGGDDLVSRPLWASLRLPGGPVPARDAGSDFDAGPRDPSPSGNGEGGPRGGLPTLKTDLLRLASLLQVTVSERDKVDDLKAKLRPMIGLLRGDDNTTSKPAPAPTASSSCSLRPSLRPTPPTLTSLPLPSAAPASLQTSGPMRGEDTGVSMSVFTSHMEAMDNLFQQMLAESAQQQTMLNQVLQHVMQMQSAPRIADTVMEGDQDWANVASVEAEASTDQTTDPRLEQLGCLQDRRRVLDNMLAERPYFVVLTVPDRSWLPRAQLRQHPDDLRQQRTEALLRLWHTLNLRFVTVGAYRILTSSQAVVSNLLRKEVAKACKETRAGLSRALVDGFEMEFDFETQCLSSQAAGHECYQMTAVPGAVDFYHETLAVDEGDQDFATDGDPDSDEDPVEQSKGEITPAIRAAVKRVHEATGLPAPRAVGEQAHVDLLVAEDAVGRTYVIAHATDAVSKFQQAALLPDKSAASVIDFLMTSWVPLLGTPRQMIADQGREFVAAEFQDWCSAHSVLLWHAAVQAPWQNGLAERSGGVLKALLAAVVTDKVVIGNGACATPLPSRFQLTTPIRRQRAWGMSLHYSALRGASLRGMLNNFAGNLAQHGLIDSDPNLMERLALREAARIAMVRLHYSQSIRKAELARSREPTSAQPPCPGDVVYFWRAQKLTRRGAVGTLGFRLLRGTGVLNFVVGMGLRAGDEVCSGTCAAGFFLGAEAIRELVEDTSNARGDSALPSVPEGELLDGEVVPVALGNVALDERQPSPLPPSASTSAPSTAAPGTPVGNLLQRPLVQHALQRAQGQPLAVQLGARALSRGQPGDFQAELRDAMQRGMRRRTSSEAGLEDRSDASRRGSHPMSDVASGQGAGAAPLKQQYHSDLLTNLLGFLLVFLKQQYHDLLAYVIYYNPWGVHPLLRVQAQVEQDRLTSRVNLEEERDHGTWDGRWSLPSRSQLETVQSLGVPLPSGLPEDHEVSAATARKEHQWSHMTEEERKLWHKAAEKGWQAYVDNEAVQVLSVKESAAIRKQLAGRGELDRILVPRFVLTDKADGLRSESNPMPIDASARLVVPGFKDRANLNGEVRRDAPTGARLARLTQHLLLCIIASKGKAWKMLSADVKSAFLKGDPYVSRELYITKTNTCIGPGIPIPEGCLARVCKGIFGLAASWFLWDGADRKELRGMIVSHVDDLLFGGDHVQVDDFTWCGKRFQRRADGSVTLSMESYHRNLKEIPLPRSRKSSLTAPLLPDERRRLRALLGSLQWLVAQLRFHLQFPVSALQGEQPTIGTILRANALLAEFLQEPTYQMVFQPIDLNSGGLVVVTDSSLGNVTQAGAGEAAPLDKVYSTVVVDAKDVHDKGNSDTSSFGSQKSLAFTVLPGDPVDGNDPLMGFLLKFAEVRGWHSHGATGVNVAHNARSYRTPEPRFSSALLPVRTTFARYQRASGELVWRALERKTRYLEEANQHGLLKLAAPVLVTFFTRD
ncbi:Ank3 [Symbiodinium necroappetens]|uniref:Ank3 protein n=1 Tax=Symbiodinium necroappetens TaxID=1628268 RepID=A0A812QRM1_9DINO|nr:Ank3 [Symbiodinium necroappetens]